jgi:hypothetical protein
VWRFFTTCTIAICAITAAAQDGATALTRNYRTLLDNEQMEVVRVHYDSHQELAVHDHSHFPTVYVYLSKSGPVRFIHDEAHAFTLTRRPVRAGWFRVSPGRLERHQVANLGPVASDFLRVECKQIALGQIRSGFRYTESIDLTKTSVRTDGLLVAGDGDPEICRCARRPGERRCRGAAGTADRIRSGDCP